MESGVGMTPSSEKRFAELCQRGHPWFLQRSDVQLHFLTSKDFGKDAIFISRWFGLVFLQKREYESQFPLQGQ